MIILTQKELLQEGFLDTVRSAGRALSRVAGGVAGAAVGAAGNVAKNLLNTQTDLFTTATAGAKAGFKKGVNIIDKKTLEKKLKEFSNNLGYWYKSHKGNNKNGTIEVAELDFDTKGKAKEGAPVNKPILYNVKDGNIIQVGRRGRDYNNSRQAQQGQAQQGQAQQGQAQQGQAQQGQNNTKPKFNEALRDWKINNIGPNAATVGINYQQAKEFIKSLGVQDADRVLTNANIQDRGSAIVSNAKLNTVLVTLKSRGVVSEKSQIFTLKESFNIIN